MLHDIIEKGFYYHYKHDPSGELNDYACEVLGVGLHTEEMDSAFVVHRPLYVEAPTFMMGKFFDVLPLLIWMSSIEVNGHTTQRFTKITDPRIIAELRLQSAKMYGAS